MFSLPVVGRGTIGFWIVQKFYPAYLKNIIFCTCCRVPVPIPGGLDHGAIQILAPSEMFTCFIQFSAIAKKTLAKGHFFQREKYRKGKFPPGMVKKKKGCGGIKKDPGAFVTRLGLGEIRWGHRG
ncbi:MAG: hypothetical protein IIC64_15440 [SAR324 cluster bacterium]|nr:hypothetical protein [SAR324 cluster bacterium]